MSFGPTLTRWLVRDLVAYGAKVSNVNIARHEVDRTWARTPWKLQATLAIHRDAHVQQRRPTIKVKRTLSRRCRKDLDCREWIDPLVRVGIQKLLPIRPELFLFIFRQC